MQAFGGPVRLFRGDEEDGTSSTTAVEDMDRVRQLLSGMNEGGEGSLRIYRPRPTAAFSPRDTTLAAYGKSAEAMRARGFTSVERRAGGQLAVYDQSTLVIDLVAQHADPRNDVIERFRHFAEVIARVLRSFSIDARVGAVPGEYCPGDYSINAGGRIKLAGIAQRIGRRGYHLGAVIGVRTSIPVKEAVVEAYRIMECDFNPETFETISDLVPGLTFAAIRKALLDAIALIIPISDYRQSIPVLGPLTN
jgi:octanoyl-[GcvH]:protein N-octanoyltransferase